MLFVESSAKTAAHVADIFIAVAERLTRAKQPASVALPQSVSAPVALPQSVKALPSVALHA